MKKIVTILLTVIIGVSMTIMPAVAAENDYATETQPATEAVQDADVTSQDAEVSEQEAEATEPTEQTVEAAGETEAIDESEPVEETEAQPQELDIDVTDGEALEGLDGLYITDIENDPELCGILDDPTFYRYYDVDEDGLITKKQIPLDEIEQFIADADANAEGIDDSSVIETDADITAMGGGVTGLGKGQTPAKYSKYNRYHCIDISWWQGKISDANWKKIKAAGVTHAIIRCGYSTLRGGEHNMDSTFAGNLNGAYKAGIKVGVYYYSTAVSAAEAKSEAQYVTSILKNYKSKIKLPVAFDYETGGRLTAKVMKSVGTASCIAFCDTIKAAGYTPMVYANYNTLTNFINYKTLQSKYKIWLANYTTNGVATTYPGSYYMWQYSSSGKVNGLSGRIDINYIFEPRSSSSSTSSYYSVSSVTSYTAKVVTAVNYRTGPGTNYSLKGSYKKGTTVTVVGVSGNWVKLSNGYFVYKTYLTTASTSSTKYPYSAKTTTTLKYRTGPGKSYKTKGVYKKGTTVKVVGMSGNWAKLSNGYYVSNKYIKTISATSSSTSNVKYPYSARTTTKVNYRTGPGKNYKKKGTYSKGVKVTIKSAENGWGRMSNGYYINLKYVK